MSNFGYYDPEAGPSQNAYSDFEYGEYYNDEDDLEIDYDELRDELRAQEAEAIGEIDVESTEYEISDDDMTEDEDDKILHEVTIQAEGEMKRLCERCRLMTSTIEGLKALASNRGYRHSKVKSVHISAENGCPFCVLLRGNHKNRSDFQADIRIFSRYPYPANHEWIEKYTTQSQSAGHPFEIVPLDDMTSALWDKNVDDEKVNVGGFSDASKLFKLRDNSSYLPFTNAGILSCGSQKVYAS